MEPQGRIMDLTDLIRARTGIILSNIVKNMLKEKNQIFFLKRKMFKNDFNMYEVLVYLSWLVRKLFKCIVSYPIF